MKRKTLELLACPTCHGGLALREGGDTEIIDTGTLVCARCQRQYAINAGIPHFIEPEELTGPNARFARFYDRFTHVYFLFNNVAFLFLGGVRKSRKEEIIDRLKLTDGRVLEVSIGPGINVPYLFEAPGQIEVYGLDISLGQLHHCQDFCRKRGLEAELFLGMAEALPFRDNAFETTFHIGGINFFGDKQAAIAEMIRVAKPGTKIAIADENEKAAQSLDWLPGAGRLFEKRREAVTTPVDLVPTAMQEIKAASIWKGTGWVVEFRKPAIWARPQQRENEERKL
jgi:ubiquinone/menaquinone biosynthesis C-methylase UbiE